MALQPFVGPWPLFSFVILYAVGMTPWTGISPSRRCHFVYNKSHIAWNWNQASGMRSRPLMTWAIARPLVTPTERIVGTPELCPLKISLPYSAPFAFRIHSRSFRTFPDSRKLRRVWEDPHNPNSVWGVFVIHAPLKGLFWPVLTPHLRTEEQRSILVNSWLW